MEVSHAEAQAPLFSLHLASRQAQVHLHMMLSPLQGVPSHCNLILVPCGSEQWQQELLPGVHFLSNSNLLFFVCCSLLICHLFFFFPFCYQSASDGFWKSVATRVPREPHEIRILNPYFIQEAAFSFIGLPFNNGLMGRGVGMKESKQNQRGGWEQAAELAAIVLFHLASTVGHWREGSLAPLPEITIIAHPVF